MSIESESYIIEKTPYIDSAIRIVTIEKYQRFCLKCGKIMPTNKLLEKSGAGNKRNPPIKPRIIDT